MPRASTGTTHFYHSQFTPHYVHNDDQHPQHGHVQNHSQPGQPQGTAAHQSPTQQTPQKKKHVCPTCDRAFTTSGHLARHSRVHTGERNHKCPFPGCETRCSRQDNLQQHYRIHLSPGSRRSSTRSAIARAMNNSIQPLSGSNATRRVSTSSGSTSSLSTIPPSLSSPPALEPARYTLSTPPDSPPALAQATLPATAHPPPESVSSRSSSSPEISYSPATSHHHSQIIPISSQAINLNSQNYSHYRSGTTTYQEQSQGAGFTYVHTTPISHSNSAGHVHSSSFYSGTHYDSHHPNLHEPPHHHSHHSHQQHHHHSPPSPPSTHVSSISSRHSISHISHPQHQSYAPNHSSNPPSPASSHSVSSQPGPATPSYPVFHDDAHSYQGSGMIMEHSPDQPGLNSGHIGPQGTLVHPSYSPTLPLPAHAHSLPPRFDSPPPTLAPIQDERVVRGDSHGRHSHSQVSSHHSPSSYMHHPQSLANEYQYHQSIGLGHSPWKADGPLRGKPVGTLVQ